MKQKLFTLLTLLCLCVTGAWADGTAISSLNFDKPTDLPSAYTYSPQNAPSIATQGNKSCVYVCNGGSTTIPTFSEDNSTPPSDGKRWMAFKPAVDCSVTISTYASTSKTFYIFDKEKNSTSNAVSTYSPQTQNTWENSWTVSLKGGTWYVLGGSGSQCYVASMQFTSSTPTLTGAWKIGDNVVTEANVVQTESATMPTFTVGATSGTPTTDNYSVAYSLKEGSTAGIFTITDGVPTAISTATAGTATIVATLTTKDNKKYLTPATNTFEYTVTVSAATAPKIDVTGAGNVTRGGSLTLTATVTEAIPDISYKKWYACDSEGTISGEALGTELTYAPVTTAVGTYYYRAVVNNGVGGDANHDVYSDVQTINVLPKAPTLTASGLFANSKEVTITKAEGEDASANIKYSTDDGANWSDYTTTLNITETTTVKAKVIQSGLESEVASATYTKLPVIVDTDLTGGASWNFTSYTNDEKAELKSCTDFWNETSKDKRYGNKVNLSNEHLRGTGGNELSITTGLKYIVTGENKLRFDPGDNRSWMDGGTQMIIPGLKAGQIVRVDLMTSKDKTPRGMNSANLRDCVGFNSTSVARNVSYGFVEADGDVTLTCNGGLNIYKVEVIPVSVSATVQSYGWATYIPAYDVEFAEGDAYVLININTSTGATKVEPVTQVPANTPVLLKGAGEKTITTLPSTPDAPSTNLMEVYDGSDKGTEVPYVLAKNGETACFKKWTGSLSVITGRAVMWLDSEIAHSRDFFFLDGETTGISNLNFNVNDNANIDANAPMYNLVGQKVGKNYKGIVIVNGKKVVRK